MKPLLAAVCLTASAFSQTLLVLNKADNEVAFVDPHTLQVLGKAPTGVGPHEVALSADGKIAYVANYGDQTPGNSLSIIDVAGRKAVKRIDLGPFVRPHGIIESNGNIYFTAEASRAVARYNPAADKVDWMAGTGQSVSHMLVESRGKIYVANIAEGTVTYLNAQNQVPPQAMKHIAVGKGPEGIDISPDGSRVWVATREDGNVHVIDTATNTVTKTMAAGQFPIRVKFTPDGKRVLVSCAEGGDLAVFDAAEQRLIKRIPTGETPVGILVTPDGKWAFVAATAAHKVLRIDLEKLELAGEIKPGNVPDGLGWSSLR